MSWDEQEAAQEAFYEQISTEAIGEFTGERLRSYYHTHFTVLQPALRTLHEASRLLQHDHLSAATVFSAAAVELFLKNTILQPLIYGLIHNENLAKAIADVTLGQTGFSRYRKLLADLFREVASLDLNTVTRTGSPTTLMVECQELSEQRNRIVHQGMMVTRQEAEQAGAIAEAVYWHFVASMVEALELYIFDDGVISSTDYSRPVPTARNNQGVLVTTQPISFPTVRPILAGQSLRAF